MPARPKPPPPPLTDEQSAVVATHLNLAYWVLSRHFKILARNRSLYADLAQAAVVGLATAAAHYRPDALFPVHNRGKAVLNPDGTPRMAPVQFTTYAYATIWGTIRKALERDHGWGGYRTGRAADVAAPSDPPRHDPLAHWSRSGGPARGLPSQFAVREGRDMSESIPDRACSPDELASRADISAQVADALRFLCDQDREMVLLRYGLHGGVPARLDDLAARYGITRQRVAQRLRRATDALRRRLGHLADDYRTLAESPHPLGVR